MVQLINVNKLSESVEVQLVVWSIWSLSRKVKFQRCAVQGQDEKLDVKDSCIPASSRPNSSVSECKTQVVSSVDAVKVVGLKASIESDSSARLCSRLRLLSRFAVFSRSRTRPD